MTQLSGVPVKINASSHTIRLLVREGLSTADGHPTVILASADNALHLRIPSALFPFAQPSDEVILTLACVRVGPEEAKPSNIILPGVN